MSHNSNGNATSSISNTSFKPIFNVNESVYANDLKQDETRKEQFNREHEEENRYKNKIVDLIKELDIYKKKDAALHQEIAKTQVDIYEHKKEHDEIVKKLKNDISVEIDINHILVLEKQLQNVTEKFETSDENQIITLKTEYIELLNKEINLNKFQYEIIQDMDYLQRELQKDPNSSIQKEIDNQLNNIQKNQSYVDYELPSLQAQIKKNLTETKIIEDKLEVESGNTDNSQKPPKEGEFHFVDITDNNGNEITVFGYIVYISDSTKIGNTASFLKERVTDSNRVYQDTSKKVAIIIIDLSTISEEKLQNEFKEQNIYRPQPSNNGRSFSSSIKTPVRIVDITKVGELITIEQYFGDELISKNILNKNYSGEYIIHQKYMNFLYRKFCINNGNGNLYTTGNVLRRKTITLGFTKTKDIVHSDTLAFLLERNKKTTGFFKFAQKIKMPNKFLVIPKENVQGVFRLRNEPYVTENYTGIQINSYYCCDNELKQILKMKLISENIGPDTFFSITQKVFITDEYCKQVLNNTYKGPDILIDIKRLNQCNRKRNLSRNLKNARERNYAYKHTEQANNAQASVGGKSKKMKSKRSNQRRTRRI